MYHALSTIQLIFFNDDYEYEDYETKTVKKFLLYV